MKKWWQSAQQHILGWGAPQRWRAVSAGGAVLLVSIVTLVFVTHGAMGASRPGAFDQHQGSSSAGGSSSALITAGSGGTATPARQQGTPGPASNGSTDGSTSGSGIGATPTQTTGGATAGATPSPAQGGVGVTPSPTQGGIGATTTPTSLPADAASIVSQSDPLTVDANRYFSLFIRVQNTGTSTWVQGYWDYSIVCTSSCPSSQVDPSTSNDIAPGQQLQFNITMDEPDNGGTKITYHPQWSLVHNRIPFGPALTVPVTIHGFYPVFQQAVPSCNNPSGVTWDWLNTGSGNAISCGGSGLMMQQGAAASYPTAVLTSINGSYDDNDIRLYAHVHFSGNSSTVKATLMFQLSSTPGQCGGIGIGITPGGEADMMSISSTCVVSSAAPAYFSAGTDWDLELTASGNGFSYLVNGRPVGGGGGYFPSAPYAGLMVIDSGASSAQVTYSKFELDQWS